MGDMRKSTVQSSTTVWATYHSVPKRLNNVADDKTLSVIVTSDPAVIDAA